MLYVDNKSLNPHYNLALEEYLLKYVDNQGDFFLFWQNSPAVIVGKFQNTIEEINAEYVKNNNINVVRRITGGGAVYHDLGNLNFTFITKNIDKNIDFSKFTEPVAAALQQLGVPAVVSGRNDITIEEKKFSGNSQCHYKGRILHHGTLLFNSQLDNVAAALNVKKEKIQSKGVKSVKSRVTNVSDYLEKKITISEFKDVLLKYIFAGKEIREYQLTADDIAKVNELMVSKYMTWDWNYGSSPDFNVKKAKRFPWGSVEFYCEVEKGIIKKCRIYGDFFSSADIGDLEKKLLGIRYEEEALASVITLEDLEIYFGINEKEDFLKFIVSEQCFLQNDKGDGNVGS